MHAAVDFPGLSRWLSDHSRERISPEFFEDRDNLAQAMSALNDLDRLVNGRSEKEIGCALRQLANAARSTQDGGESTAINLWPADTD